jgi:predicted PurR-regulated permease PerM
LRRSSPALLVASAFVQQAVQAATELQAKWGQGQLALDKIWQTTIVQTAAGWLGEHGVTENDIREWTKENIQGIAGFLAAQAGKWAANVLVFLFSLFVTLFATFYLLRDGPEFLARVRDILPISETRRQGLIDIAYNVLYASVVSSFVVAAVQGTLGGLLFWILGIDKPLLWGVVMGFLSLLPLLGSWIVWVPAGLTLLYSGAYWKAAILLAVALGIISTVDNILRPWLISGRVQLNGLLIFISILGGIAAFGMIGVLLGPILVALGEAVLLFFSGGDEMSSAPSKATSDAT